MMEILAVLASSIFMVDRHCFRICIHKRLEKTEYEERVLQKNSVSTDVLLTVLQVFMGYQFLIHPLISKEISWTFLTVITGIVYFWAVLVDLFAFWYYGARIKR